MNYYIFNRECMETDMTILNKKSRKQNSVKVKLVCDTKDDENIWIVELTNGERKELFKQEILKKNVNK